MDICHLCDKKPKLGVCLCTYININFICFKWKEQTKRTEKNREFCFHKLSPIIIILVKKGPKGKSMIWKETCTPIFIAVLFTVAKTQKQPNVCIDRGMDKEDVVHIYNGVLFSYKKEWNNAICSNMDGPRECHAEWSKSDREGEISYDIPYMWNLERNDRNEPTYKTETDSQTPRTSLWLQGEGDGGMGDGIVREFGIGV